MRDVVIAALTGFNWFVLVYFLVLNSGYLGLIGLAAVDLAKRVRREEVNGQDDIFANPLTPGITVVAPAFNEALSIIDSVHSLLALRYPQLEVVVVDDGSTDETFERLRATFDLVPIERTIPDDIPTIGAVRSVHAAATGDPLIVVRKDNAGRRSDPINVGINAARTPLVCVIDADSLLDEGALLAVAKPFVDEPERVVASGGVIRAVNGSRVERGRIVESRMPATWLARIQVVEYLRSFLLGRTGWSRMGALLIISGAFGLFRRDVLVEVGGLHHDCIGEDAELTARIHRHMRDRGRDYRVVFVSEPVCWTEVPDRAPTLARQRRRWSRGLAEVLWIHRRMMLNPRYGAVGMLTLPYYLAFELLGPVVELIGLASISAGFALGIVDPLLAALVAGAALGYGLMLGLAAICVEELSYHRYHRWRDLGLLIAATFLEQAGPRQLQAYWRLQGLWGAIRSREATWEPMVRTGFDQANPLATARLETAATAQADTTPSSSGGPPRP